MATGNAVVRPPHPHDVISFAGPGETQTHPGNHRLLNLVRVVRPEYQKLSASSTEKGIIVAQVISAIRGLSPPGRFLRMEQTGAFVEIGDKDACQLVAQALSQPAAQNRAVAVHQSGFIPQNADVGKRYAHQVVQHANGYASAVVAPAVPQHMIGNQQLMNNQGQHHMGIDGRSQYPQPQPPPRLHNNIDLATRGYEELIRAEQMRLQQHRVREVAAALELRKLGVTKSLLRGQSSLPVGDPRPIQPAPQNQSSIAVSSTSQSNMSLESYGERKPLPRAAENIAEIRAAVNVGELKHPAPPTMLQHPYSGSDSMSAQQPAAMVDQAAQLVDLASSEQQSTECKDDAAAYPTVEKTKAQVDSYVLEDSLPEASALADLFDGHTDDSVESKLLDGSNSLSSNDEQAERANESQTLSTEQPIGTDEPRTASEIDSSHMELSNEVKSTEASKEGDSMEESTASRMEKPTIEVGELLPSEERTVQEADPAENAKQITFFCRKCQTPKIFSCARTAAASFASHFKGCKGIESQRNQQKAGLGVKKKKKRGKKLKPAKVRKSNRAKVKPPVRNKIVPSSNKDDGLRAKPPAGSNIVNSTKKCGALPFSIEDDLLIQEGYEALGRKWTQISIQYFNGERSGKQLGDRFICKEYKQRVGDRSAKAGKRMVSDTPSSRKRKRPRASELPVKERGGTTKASAYQNTPQKLHIAPQILDAEYNYPHAPMGHLWLDKSLSSLKPPTKDDSDGSQALSMEGSLIGRRWVWDEGYYVDGQVDPRTRNRDRQLEISLLKGGCVCRAKAPIPANADDSSKAKSENGKTSGRVRRSETKSMSTVSGIAEELAAGQLDPHTLISCDEYERGPEFRFAENPQPENAQPFMVRVNPDSAFLADLHAHLCSSEIIGLLGGHYSKEEKCIYIQAAFPCKATDRMDSGSTDVEMDPIGQIYATEAIANHGLSVVGWYHSHPDFQPTPSVVDVENQASYQQLFQGESLAGSVPPFVGLIVGTYDGKNPTSHSVMRWFHVRSKATSETSVNYPMNLRITHRHYREMTFDDQSTEGSIRRSMSLHGPKIRRALESRRFSCPDSGKRWPLIGGTTAESGAPVTAVKSDQGESAKISCVDADAHKQAQPNENCSNEEYSLSVMETGESPVLLSDALFEKAPESRRPWKFEQARPLHFTEDERSILDMDDDSVPYDVFAGIIWFAVEREQQMLSRGADRKSTMPSIPASSRSILELLLRQSLTSSNILHQKLYTMMHCLEDSAESTAAESTALKGHVGDNDAAIVHNVDAILGHYAPKLNKINPFTAWTGAGDKGKELASGSCKEPWVDFYVTNILQMKPVEGEDGSVYKGGVKMRRGHKIATSLLKWARNMQLGSVCDRSDKRNTFPVDSSQFSGLCFDHEQTLANEARTGSSSSTQRNQYVYFVSEVMRLLAARWRECGTRANGRSTPKRRGRPPKRLSTSGSRPMSSLDEDEGSWKCVKCPTTNDLSRTRCSGCMGWKPGSRKLSSSGNQSTSDEDDGSWKCNKCSTLNEGSKSRCGSCLGWKGGSRKKWKV